MGERKVYGYIRVSSKEQNEQRQWLALLKEGVPRENIYLDKQSGKDFSREQYQRLVHHKLRKGDLLVVTSLDRLGRNYEELQEEWRYITRERRANIQVLDMPLLDTRRSEDLVGTLISDLVLQLLSFVAHQERDMIRRRQAEGIAAARLRGVHLGRPVSPVPEWFPGIYDRWRSGELTTWEAREACGGMKKDAFYRLARKHRKQWENS